MSKESTRGIQSDTLSKEKKTPKEATGGFTLKQL